jgi:hypothetical protein
MTAERPSLDDLLDAGDEAALAEAARGDPSLGEALARQRAIDASLRRSFALPDLEGLHQRLEEAVEVGAVMMPDEPRMEVVPLEVAPPRRASWLGHPVVTLVAAVAAILLLVLVGRQTLAPPARVDTDPMATLAPSVPDPSEGPPTVASRWVDLYRGLPPDGFGVPQSPLLGESPDGASCASDGSSALVIRPTPGLTVRSECSSESPCSRWGLDASRAVELTVEPQALRVLVFVHTAQADPRPSLPAGSRFHLHRRQLGHLVLYELSPLTRPVGLPAFEL